MADNIFVKIWNVVDEVVIAGALFPLLKGLATKTAEGIGKRVVFDLGLDTEKAKKDPTDEILYGTAEFSLGDDEVRRLQQFEAWLRAKDRKRAEAYVLYVAKAIRNFEREVRETEFSAKGQKGPKIEKSYKDITEGINWALKFFRQLLAFSSNTEMEKFIEDKNIFSSLISEENKIFTAEKAKNVSKRTTDFLKEQNVKLKGRLEENTRDIDTTLSSLEGRAKSWRDAGRRKRI